MPLTGQTRTSRPSCRLSVSPPRADIQLPPRHVRFVLPAQPVDATQALPRTDIMQDAVVYRRITQLRHRIRPSMLAVGETPPQSADPATLLGNLLIAIEARDLLPASLGEGLAQRSLGHLVAASGAGKDRNPRNPIS